MSNKDHIEDLFRKRFENEESPVSNRVWENIKSSLPSEKPEKPGRLLYFWTLLALLVVGVSTFGIYNNIQHGNKIPEGGSLVSSLGKSEEINKGGNKSSIISIDQNILDNESKNAVRINENSRNSYPSIRNDSKRPDPLFNQKRSNSINISKLNAPDKDGMTSKTSDDELESNPKTEVEVELHSSKNIKNGDQDQLTERLRDFNTKIDSDKNETNSIIGNSNNENEIANDNGKINNDIERGNSRINNKGQREIVINGDLLEKKWQTKNMGIETTTTDDSSQDLLLKKSFTSLNEITNASSDSSAKKQPIENKPAEEQVVVKEKTAKRKIKENPFFTMPISMDLFLSPNISYRSVSGSVVYQNDINSFEKVRPNIGGGLRLNIELSERIKIGLGLAYNSYGENYTISKDKMAEKYQVNYKIYQDSMNVTHFDPIDTVKFHQPGKSRNHYNYLSIPLSATYFITTGKISVGITGGAAANFLLNASTSRVEFYSDSLTRVVQESSTNSNSPFRPLAISIFASPIMTCELNDKWKLFVEPGFTYFINSLYKSDYSLKRNLYAVEVKAGIRFKFN